MASSVRARSGFAGAGRRAAGRRREGRCARASGSPASIGAARPSSGRAAGSTGKPSRACSMAGGEVAGEGQAPRAACASHHVSTAPGTVSVAGHDAAERDRVEAARPEPVAGRRARGAAAAFQVSARRRWPPRGSARTRRRPRWSCAGTPREHGGTRRWRRRPRTRPRAARRRPPPTPARAGSPPCPTARAPPRGRWADRGRRSERPLHPDVGPAVAVVVRRLREPVGAGRDAPPPRAAARCPGAPAGSRGRGPRRGTRR